MENGSVNNKSVFTFKLCHIKAFDDYVMYNDALPYTMELLGMWRPFH